jgi:hypothetical protein
VQFWQQKTACASSQLGRCPARKKGTIAFKQREVSVDDPAEASDVQTYAWRT